VSEGIIAIGDYARFMTKNAEYIPLRAYQNFFVAQTRTWGATQYLFAPFGLDGDISVRIGETPQSALVSVPNAITVALFTEAVASRYMIEVEKVAIQMTPGDPPTFMEQVSLGKYLWAVTGYEAPSDGESLSLRLTGPRNAVDRQVPTGRLTSEKVGAMPATGAIYTS
jgi:hypothetical protein